MRATSLLQPPAATSFPPREDAGPSVQEQILLHLDERGYVPFHPTLAEKFGHKAAVFVGMALYWTRHSLRNHPQRSGWFNMSIQQWQAAIGISRTEQTTVRQALTESGVLEEMLLGRPAVMHFRLNVSALAKALARSGDDGVPTWDTVSSWFRGYHNYYKPLADIAGSVGAGLYLSLLLQWHRAAVLRGQLSNGCVEVSQDDISRALCLGPKVQRNARLRLKKGRVHPGNGSSRRPCPRQSRRGAHVSSRPEHQASQRLDAAGRASKTRLRPYAAFSQGQ
ncbi:hypothetical protein GO497_01140 [Acidovorax citrulli]|nr:hypothetical protein [Paracidovorax citrulli]